MGMHILGLVIFNNIEDGYKKLTGYNLNIGMVNNLK